MGGSANRIAQRACCLNLCGSLLILIDREHWIYKWGMQTRWDWLPQSSLIGHATRFALPQRLWHRQRIRRWEALGRQKHTSRLRAFALVLAQQDSLSCLSAWDGKLQRSSIWRSMWLSSLQQCVSLRCVFVLRSMEEGIAWRKSKQLMQQQEDWLSRLQKQPLAHNPSSLRAQARMGHVNLMQLSLQCMMTAVYEEQSNNASRQALRQLLTHLRRVGGLQNIQEQPQKRSDSALSKPRHHSKQCNLPLDYVCCVKMWWLRPRDRNSLLHALFGNLRMMSVNISSWRTKSAWLLEQECEMLLLQETRVQRSQIKSAVALARSAGWRAHFTTARENDIAGGVAILTKPPLRSHCVWSDDSGRGCIVSVRAGPLTMNVLCVYTFCQDMVRSEALLQRCHQRLLEVGNDPAILAADLNGAVQDYDTTQLFAEAGWARAHPEHIPTCYHAELGTSIDVVLLSPSLLPLFAEGQVSDDPTPQPHRALQVDLRAQAGLRYPQLRHPRRLHPQPPSSTTSSHSPAGPPQQVVRRVIQAVSIDTAWESWADEAVRYLGGSDRDVAQRQRQQPPQLHLAPPPAYSARSAEFNAGFYPYNRLRRLDQALRAAQVAHGRGHRQQQDRMLQCIARRGLLSLLQVNLNIVIASRRADFWDILVPQWQTTTTDLLAQETSHIAERRRASWAAWRCRTHPCKAMATVARDYSPLPVQGWDMPSGVVTDPSEMCDLLADEWAGEWNIDRASSMEAFSICTPFSHKHCHATA